MNWLKALLLGGVALALASCATSSHPGSPAETGKLVWPPPPSEPRIAFVQSIRGPLDIGQHSSFWRSAANWITGDSAESLNLRKPFGVALDEKGNLCITDTDANQVCYCDFERKEWRCYAAVGKNKFTSPVAVARRNGIFYVADSGLSKIIAFRDDGKLVFEVGAPLKRPVGLVIAGESLLVADSQAHAVFVFGLDGTFKFSFGQRGGGPGEFNFPTCLAVDGAEHVLVTDTLNSRVQTFDRQGHFLSQFGSNGDTPGHFARPKGIAADGAGHLYVVDAVLDSFQILDREGQLLLNVGNRGNGPGEFGLPHGIAIDSAGRIFVADAFNHRVQVFQYLGR
jgi:sugar lactone lactonase YvrE